MNRQRTKNAVWSWEATGAVCSFAGGMAAALLGSVLTASTWVLGAAAHPWIRGLGTALLILTIPLLILAGYCMDWAERKSKNSRLPTSENGERGSASVYQALAVAIVLTVILIAPFELHAQQTTFNVPTSDVLDKGVVTLANRAGGQFGFEHPLNKKATLAADWFTGKHTAGYFTPGMVFKLGPKVTGYAAYSVANQNLSKGNHFILLELGYNFN